MRNWDAEEEEGDCGEVFLPISRAVVWLFLKHLIPAVANTLWEPSPTEVPGCFHESIGIKSVGQRLDSYGAIACVRHVRHICVLGRENAGLVPSRPFLVAAVCS